MTLDSSTYTRSLVGQKQTVNISARYWWAETPASAHNSPTFLTVTVPHKQWWFLTHDRWRVILYVWGSTGFLSDLMPMLDSGGEVTEGRRCICGELSTRRWGLSLQSARRAIPIIITLAWLSHSSVPQSSSTSASISQTLQNTQERQQWISDWEGDYLMLPPSLSIYVL